MIDDRTLCVCGHDEFDHGASSGPTKCDGELGYCKCTLFTPLEPFLQGD